MLSSSALSCSDLLLVVCVSVGDISLRVAMWKAINSYEAERSGAKRYQFAQEMEWNGIGWREKGREGKGGKMEIDGNDGLSLTI